MDASGRPPKKKLKLSRNKENIPVASKKPKNDEFRKKEADRQRKYRKRPKTDEEIARIRERGRLRAKKFRDKRKAEGLKQHPRMAQLSPQQQENLRAYNRQKKRESRERLAKRKVEEKEAEPRTVWLTKNQLYVASKRAKNSLPRNPITRAQVIAHLYKQNKKPKCSTTEAGASIRHTEGTRLVRKLKTHKRNKKLRQHALLVASIQQKYDTMRQAAKSMGLRYRTLRRAVALKQEAEDDKIANFYISPEISIELPDRKRVGTRFMTSTVQRAYNKYVEETGNSVSQSTFYRHRPSSVRLACKTPQRQCICEICANASLALTALASAGVKVSTDLQTVTNDTLCPGEKGQGSLQCLYRQCDKCGTESVTARWLTGLNAKKQCSWKRWDYVKKANGNRRMILSIINGSLEQLVNLCSEDLTKLSSHLYEAKWQYQQYKNIKESLPEDTILQVLDFAKNYLCQFQDEPQPVYYDHNQTTIHPIVNFYRTKPEGKIITDEVIFISDDLKHDSQAVEKFVDLNNEHLRSKGLLSNATRVVQFTDQAPTQYKSKHAFYQISQKKHHTRIFFGKRHGKGPADGAIGRVKRAVYDRVQRREVTVKDAEDFFNVCKTALETRDPEADFQQHFKFVPTSTIKRSAPAAILHPVKDTKGIHQVRGIKPGVVEVRNLGCTCNFCIFGVGVGGETCNSHNVQWRRVNLLTGRTKDLSHAPTKKKTSLKKRRKPKRKNTASSEGEKQKAKSLESNKKITNRTNDTPARITRSASRKAASGQNGYASDKMDTNTQPPTLQLTEKPEVEPKFQRSKKSTSTKGDSDRPQRKGKPQAKDQSASQVPKIKPVEPKVQTSKKRRETEVSDRPEKRQKLELPLWPSETKQSASQILKTKAVEPKIWRSNKRQKKGTGKPEREGKLQVPKIKPDAGKTAKKITSWTAAAQRFRSCSTFSELETVVEAIAKSDISRSVLPVQESVALQVDYSSVKYVPKELSHMYPVQIYGDGNCLPRTLSVVCYGSQRHFFEMRSRLVFEGVLNKKSYLDDEHLMRGSEQTYAKATLSQVFAQYSSFYIDNDLTPENVQDIYEKEILQVAKDRTYCGLWQLAQTASVLHCPVRVHYPLSSNMNIYKDMNRCFYPIKPLEGRRTVHIMWTMLNANAPNHFVPLMPKTSEEDQAVPHTRVAADSGPPSSTLDESITEVAVIDLTVDIEEAETKEVQPYGSSSEPSISLEERLALAARQTPEEVTATEEAQEEVMDIEEAQEEVTTTEDTPVEVTATEEAQVEVTPTEEAQEEVKAVEEAQEEATATEEDSEEVMTTDEASEEATTTEETPVNMSPTEEFQVEVISTEEAQVKVTAKEKAQVEVTAKEEAQEEVTATEETQVEVTAKEDATTTEDTPVEVTAVEVLVEVKAVEEAQEEVMAAEEAELNDLELYTSAFDLKISEISVISLTNEVYEEVFPVEGTVFQPSEPPLKGTPTDKAPEGDPAKVMPTMEDPAKETPTEEDPEEVTPTEDIQVEVKATEEVPENMKVTEEAQGEVTVTDEACEEVTATGEAQVDVTPTEEVSEEVTATDEARKEVTTTGEAQVDVTPTEEVTATKDIQEEVTPTNEAQVDVTTTEDTPVEVTATEEVQVEVSPTEEVQVEVKAPQEAQEEVMTTEEDSEEVTTTEQASEEVTTTGKTPVNMTPKEEAQVEVTATEEAQEEVTAKEEVQQDVTTTEDTPVEVMATEEAQVEVMATEEVLVEVKAVEEAQEEATATEEAELNDLELFTSAFDLKISEISVISLTNEVFEEVFPVEGTVFQPSEPPLKGTPTDKAPEGDPAEVMPTVEDPAKETPTEEDPEEVTPTEDIQVEVKATEEVPENMKATEEAPGEVTVTDEACEEVTPTEEVSEEVTATDEAREEVTTTGEAQVDVTPTEEVTATKEIQEEATPTNEAQVDVTATEEVPEEVTATDEAREEVTATGEAQVDVTPTEEVTATDEAREDVTATGEAQVDVTPTEEVPEEVTATKNTQEEVTATEEAQVEEKLAPLENDTPSVESIATGNHFLICGHRCVLVSNKDGIYQVQFYKKQCKSDRWIKMDQLFDVEKHDLKKKIKNPEEIPVGKRVFYRWVEVTPTQSDHKQESKLFQTRMASIKCGSSRNNANLTGG